MTGRARPTDTAAVRHTSIPAAFNGPRASAHGGYACATFARTSGLRPPVAVTLIAPPPLETPIELVSQERRCSVYAHGELIATVTAVSPSLGADIAGVDLATAAAAARKFTDLGHPFPTCFVCGHQRTDGAGLALTPGPVPDRPDTVACPWTPRAASADGDGVPGEGIVPEELIWSVLDCPGGWVRDPAVAPAVLTRMSTEITGVVLAERPHVVVGTLLRAHGRSRTVATALYTETMTLVAKATATWTELAIPPAAGD
ncbi:hypothetical protein NONI108955_30265 [Nocardia ninae]|uniref:Uncharacterized protein n=1 Tax=Nocardia ninae NBRC 108245 TaxID=1210091 RepID=A0A511MGT3_9NOCA|nr:hypothetical protein [Nocardia ninae]GEM39799.1 hypothetical protein NN4_43180 [Nocardia ninae NBRC 108245]